MDKKKKAEKKPRGKKLELNKEAIQELSEGELDQVAGGVGTQAVNCRVAVEKVTAKPLDPNPTTYCSDG